MTFNWIVADLGTSLNTFESMTDYLFFHIPRTRQPAEHLTFKGRDSATIALPKTVDYGQPAVLREAAPH